MSPLLKPNSQSSVTKLKFSDFFVFSVVFFVVLCIVFSVVFSIVFSVVFSVVFAYWEIVT